MILSDFCVLEGEYDLEKNQYQRFLICHSSGRCWGVRFEITRDQLIETMEDGWDIEVCQPEDRDDSSPIRRLFLVVVGGQKYIRADQQPFAADYIWDALENNYPRQKEDGGSEA